jgi:hypothetical protein
VGRRLLRRRLERQRRGQPRQGALRALRTATVDPAQGAVDRVGKHLRPNRLGFADHNGIGVLQGIAQTPAKQARFSRPSEVTFVASNALHEGLAATQFPFTHAGITCSQDGVAGVEQVAQRLCAFELRLLTKLEDIALGSGMLQFQMQRLCSDRRTQSELFLHPLELYLVSMEVRIAA